MFKNIHPQGNLKGGAYDPDVGSFDFLPDNHTILPVNYKSKHKSVVHGYNHVEFNSAVGDKVFTAIDLI